MFMPINQICKKQLAALRSSGGGGGDGGGQERPGRAQPGERKKLTLAPISAKKKWRFSLWRPGQDLQHQVIQYDGCTSRISSGYQVGLPIPTL